MLRFDMVRLDLNQSWLLCAIQPMRFLKDEAREKHVNLNSLMQRLLRKYFEWDRYAEKFKFVQIPQGEEETPIRIA